MEKHHKLRRDPSWSPHGCNICGVEGHQAAQCPNGTINWRKRFPPGELTMFDVPQPRPAPDYAGIEAQARAFALKREELEAVARGAAAAGAAGAAGGPGDTAMQPA